MTYAWIATVEVAAGADLDQLSKQLRGEIIPATEQAAGFQRGYWFRHATDPLRGAVVVLFDSEEAAQQASAPEGTPEVTMLTRDLYEITAEA
jgi:hypothetical protein